MIRRTVDYAPEAEDDLLALYEFLATEAEPATAIRFMRRLRAWLDGFDLAAERGTGRDDIQRGLRIIGFERRVTVAFAVGSVGLTGEHLRRRSLQARLAGAPSTGAPNCVES